MATKLTLEYDKVGDILYITKTPPYVEQDEDEIEDGIVARFHPKTNEIEGLEILFFMNRLSRGDQIELPLAFTTVPISNEEVVQSPCW